jgi:hypothetical protein
MTKVQLLLLKQKLLLLRQKQINKYIRITLEEVKQNTINNKLERGI